MPIHKSGQGIARYERCRTRRFPGLLLALVFLLVGCGQVTVSSQGTTSTPTATGSTPTPAKNPGRASTDCPLPQAPADVGTSKPDVIVSQNPQDAGTTQPITLTQGQHLEIRLQPGFAWRLTLSDPHDVLLSPGSGGWYDASARACIWRFTAASQGTAQLNYQGAMVCPPLESCPSVEQSASYAVTIQ